MSFLPKMTKVLPKYPKILFGINFPLVNSSEFTKVSTKALKNEVRTIKKKLKCFRKRLNTNKKNYYQIRIRWTFSFIFRKIWHINDFTKIVWRFLDWFHIQKPNFATKDLVLPKLDEFKGKFIKLSNQNQQNKIRKRFKTLKIA